ncbi:hypothetical protein Nepgr_006617 [Nepenthes gracilis]|uniref:NAC domain-containing protein n=1 Tax=Nepenthes gracilis TaxID=150966 RepID=A0AAD3S5D1_NEPGR|nr:hypothetical protein Nepgr_006617 [Nepenthes gracilis]
MLRMEEVVREWDGGGGEVNEQGLPPGFRFHPTDEELITFYLASKVFHGTFSGVDIPQVDLNRCEPWDLPESAKMGGIEWYFFSVRDRKYPTGLRTNRATGAGYWKATGKDRRVYGAVNGALLGMKKTLVFYRGRAPRGLKTRWVMHEYRLDGHFSCRHTCKEQYQPQQKQPTAAAATAIAKQCKTGANFSRILQVPRDSHNINNNINLQFSQSHWLHRSSQISPPPSLSPCPPQYPLDFGTDWSGFDFRADVAALEVAASGVEPRLSVEAPHIEVTGESWP